MASRWLRLFRPVIRPFRFSYYGRPHCRYPWVHEDSWGIIHVICGSPPVDVIDVRGLETVLRHLETGDAAMVEVMPRLLGALMDETGGLAVCELHKAYVFEKVAEIFAGATEEEQESLRKWLNARSVHRVPATRGTRPADPVQIVIKCWQCKEPLPFSAETRGRRVRCAKCGTKQVLPN